jgi:hypothetical protein
VRQIANSVDTVVCSPDDGWKYHPKHVEHFPDVNKLCNVASCWIYIGILLGAHPILHISRIRVKGKTAVKGSRGRRYKQLLDDFEENRLYQKLKEKALQRSVWRTHLGRGCGPLIRQTKDLMNAVLSKCDSGVSNAAWPD